MDINNEHPEESSALAAAKIRYAPFLERNPEAKISSMDFEGVERLFVETPWGDRSLALDIPDNDNILLDALNSLKLPPRYTAIYHYDKKVLEVIWTAYKLDNEQSELSGRKFELDMPDGAQHSCEFSRSSERLMEIARRTIPREISSTGFRNLQSFSGLIGKEQNNEDGDGFIDPYGEPLSFWIGNIEWDDELILNLVRHINFYLKYYDSKSPSIEIHPVEKAKAAPKNRYLDGFGFPERIVTPQLDTKLMVMYSSRFNPTAVSTNFLNLYRVVEYVSLDFMHDSAKSEVRNIIGKPHALHAIDKTINEVMLVLREIKTQREQDAIPIFLRTVITPSHLWRELENNKNFFTKPTEFEGGLTVNALFNEKATSETFCETGVESFARSCTKIRNGLAHGRDKASADSILPTSRNFALLRPWVNALLACAGEVVLYAGRN